MDAVDQKILSLLRQNARAPTSALARELGLSRSTVQDRISRMERTRVISGYTVRMGRVSLGRRIRAHVMIAVEAKNAANVVTGLRILENLTALYAVTGEFDLVAIISADTTEAIDATIDTMRDMRGVIRTESSILLSTKFER